MSQEQLSNFSVARQETSKNQRVRGKVDGPEGELCRMKKRLEKVPLDFIVLGLFSIIILANLWPHSGLDHCFGHLEIYSLHRAADRSSRLMRDYPAN